MATVQTFSSTMGNRALGKLTIVHNSQSDTFDPADGNSTVTITGTVFEAVYGTTTYAEVYAAFQAGQSVFTKDSLGHVAMNLVRVQNNECRFVGMDEMGHAIEATLDSDDNWSIDRNNFQFSLFETAIAPVFVSGPMYDAGKVVTYRGKLYRFKVSHQGAWGDNDVDEIDMSKFPVVDYISTATTNSQLSEILNQGRIPVFKMPQGQGTKYLRLSYYGSSGAYFYSISYAGGSYATLYWARLSLSDEWTSGSKSFSLS